MKIRMKDNYGIEYDGVRENYDPIGIWPWMIDHVDGAFAGTRVLFSAMVWEPVPEPVECAIDVILVDRKGFRAHVRADRRQRYISVPVRCGAGFAELRFERTAEIIDGKMVFREDTLLATGGIVKGDQ